MPDDNTPHTLRQRIRQGLHTSNTSGFAPGFVQCNIVILPTAFRSRRQSCRSR